MIGQPTTPTVIVPKQAEKRVGDLSRPDVLLPGLVRQLEELPDKPITNPPHRHSGAAQGPCLGEAAKSPGRCGELADLPIRRRKPFIMSMLRQDASPPTVADLPGCGGLASVHFHQE